MRYVVLYHDYEGGHYDFMLEAGQVLRTWKLMRPPEAGRPQPATQLFDHRLMYLDYEGPVSSNRGHVTRWDGGTYEGALDVPIRLVLSGQRLRGRVELRHCQGEAWELYYEQ